MRREIEDAQEQHAPRPRFRFKSRADVEARRVKGHDQSARDEEEAANAAATSAQLEKAAAARTGAAGADETVFADETGKELAIRPGELARAGKGGDVRLRNLEDCVVSLCDTVTSLHVIGLRRCHVYVGAVVSSTMMDDCVDCTVMVGSGQVRDAGPWPLLPNVPPAHARTPLWLAPHEVPPPPPLRPDPRPPEHPLRPVPARAEQPHHRALLRHPRGALRAHLPAAAAAAGGAWPDAGSTLAHTR